MAILIPEIISKKVRHQANTREEIEELVMGYTKGAVPDYQMAAWLMAVFLNGMTRMEVADLTQVMLHSGEVVDLSYVPGFKVDKHSTGGIGDKASLILAPIVAAAGLKVPMISGRGLGHTGGTLDKLEGIPGFSTQLGLGRFKEGVAKVGLCFMGQTKEICPADKKIYALRDVTSTVASLHLISASIMSKKLAEGIDGLVLDVKYGSGAFMKGMKDAGKLARSLMDIGKRGGKKVVAFLTNMNQPLGRLVGNALEVEECVAIMKSAPDAKDAEDTRELSLQLAAAMIWVGGKARSLKDGYAVAREILDSGRAFKKFEEVVRFQGGDLAKLPRATRTFDVKSPKNGYVTAFDAEILGYASICLGAGRLKSDDQIDPAAGLKIHRKLGEKVAKGDALFTLYASDDGLFRAAEERALASIVIQRQRPRPFQLISRFLT